MRIAKGKGTEILKRSIVPLTTGLLVFAFLPRRRFGWLDVEVTALAVLMATIAGFAVSYLREKLRHNNPN